MVSVFPDPESVRRGAVEYLATPENIGWVAIGCVLLALAFQLGWILKGFAPRHKEITTAHIVRALNDETYDQTILTPKNLAKIIGWLPKWITFPARERAAWLNCAARQWWPFLNRAISNSVVSSVEPILNRLVEGSNVKMNFSKFTLGIEPLVFVSIRAVTEVPNEVGLDIEAKWAAADPEVQLDVQFMGLTLPIAIEKVEFFGVVRIVFGPLCDWWPSFSAMQVAFIGKPTINFNLRLVGGDITAFPFIEKLLTNLIKNVLVNLMVWPNKLDIGITNDLGAKSVSNSGIVRITVKRASNLPQLDRLKAAAKMRPAVELVVTDGEYGKPKIVRATKVGEGQDPTYVNETFDVRVHDIRGAKLSLCVVDTATTYKNVKAAGRQALGVGKREPATEVTDDADEDRDVALEKRLGASRMSKAEKSTEMHSTIDGQKRLKKSSQSVLGLGEYEVGALVDKPYEETSVVLSLSNRKDLTSKMARAFASGKRDERGNRIGPEIEFVAKYMPFDEIEEDVEEQERVRGMSLEDIIAGGDLAQFCGVLHVRLIRGDHLAAKDANGRSDPFVKLSIGKQLHKSSTKRETLNPVWDEEFDFVVGMAELQNKTRLRLEVWDWDSDGKREYMGNMSLDVKRVIGQILLLAGQASRVLKRVDELEETSSGRLHVELEFYSVKSESEKVAAAVTAQAKQEVAMETAAKRRAGKAKAGDAKSDVADKKQEMMANMSSRVSDAADAKGRETEEERDDEHVSDADDRVSDADAEARAAELAALYDDDAPEPPPAGGCFGGCFGGGPKKASSSGSSRANASAPPPPRSEATHLPRVELASPLPTSESPSAQTGETEEAPETRKALSDGAEN